MLRGEISWPSKIPPTKHKLHQHVKHVNYEAVVRKNALKQCKEFLDVNQHGGGVMDGTYKGHWMNNQTAPEKVLELVVCEKGEWKITEQFLTTSFLYRYMQMQRWVSR